MELDYDQFTTIVILARAFSDYKYHYNKILRSIINRDKIILCLVLSFLQIVSPLPCQELRDTSPMSVHETTDHNAIHACNGHTLLYQHLHTMQ
jgi:hypothetical protein